MGTLAIFSLVLLLVDVETASMYTCDGPSGSVCLEPRCIQTTADILRVMDLDADPCQDFYQYVCGNYADVTKIPEGQYRWTPFQQTERENRIIMRKLLEQDGYDYKGVRSEALVKAKTYYQACMNQTISEEAGVAPLLRLIETAGGWDILGGNGNAGQGGASLVHRLAEIYKVGFQALFAMDIGPDDKNASRNILQFQQYGLSLYQPQFYASDTSPRLDAFVELGATVMTLLQNPADGTERSRIKGEARARMQDVVEFERTMSKLFIPGEKLYEPLTTYNKMTLQKFSDMMPDFDLFGYVSQIFGKELSSDTEVLVYTPAYFRKLNKLIVDTPPRVLEDYCMWSLTRRQLGLLPKPFQDAELEYVKAFRGVTARPPLADTCMSEVDRYFGFVTGALFVEEKASEAGKQKTEEMLRYIQDAFLENLPRVSWMDKKAREITEDKARAMRILIGFPDWVLDPNQLDEYYEGLVVTTESRLDNRANFKRFQISEGLKNLDYPVNEEGWDLSPSKVVTEYDLALNQMAFPSGILQPPFFSTDLPTSMDFGAIGVIMAHELTHGFDTDGRLYDKYGHLNNWLWGDEAYKEKADCISRQYSQYHVEGQNIDGQLTSDENIADVGGLKIAHLAYRRWRQDNTDDLALPLNLTPSQEFFVGMGQVWCSYYTPEALQSHMQASVHAYEKYRVIGPLSNLPAFSEAFQCPEGSPMNPVDKCDVW